MYAIIKTGGKQYKAAANKTLIVEKIEGNPGDVIEFDQVLALSEGEGKLSLGVPFVKGAKVKASILRQAKAKKIIGFTYKPKKNQHRRWGHRQLQTHLKVEEVIKG